MVMPASRWAPRPCSGVAAFPWNQWQLCYGISGNFRVEQVAALAWHRWQDSPGIGGSFGVEYADVQAVAGWGWLSGSDEASYGPWGVLSCE